jgi:hypothetical protein
MSEMPRVGEPAPDIELQGVGGRTWSLAAQRGRPVVAPVDIVQAQALRVIDAGRRAWTGLGHGMAVFRCSQCGQQTLEQDRF